MADSRVSAGNENEQCSVKKHHPSWWWSDQRNGSRMDIVSLQWEFPFWETIVLLETLFVRAFDRRQARPYTAPHRLSRLTNCFHGCSQATRGYAFSATRPQKRLAQSIAIYSRPAIRVRTRLYHAIRAHVILRWGAIVQLFNPYQRQLRWDEMLVAKVRVSRWKVSVIPPRQLKIISVVFSLQIISLVTRPRTALYYEFRNLVYHLSNKY